MFYDIIIIGGGISGIYTLYKLSQKNPKLKILLLEKNKKLGGRISTYKDQYMTLEEGSGRFSDSHELFINLLNELKLQHRIRKSSSNVVFMPSGNRGNILKIYDAPLKTNPSFLETLADPLLNYGLDLLFDENSLPCTRLIAKVVIESKFDNKEVLQKQTFLQYASKVLDKNQIKFIWDCFGYSNELSIMNAYDCISLMNTLSPMNQFYFLKGGLSEVIERMVDVIKKNKNIVIMTRMNVLNIKQSRQTLSSVTSEFIIKVFVGEVESLRRETLKMTQESKEFKKDCRRGEYEEYKCNKVICALPKEALEKLDILEPIRTKWLEKVNSGTLCRIYSRFNKDKNGKYWFQDLPKFTTNNSLRMVIPYNTDTGVIMISYSDGEYADSWQQLYKEKGLSALEERLKILIKESTGISIPNPRSTRIFYWKHGVGYWGLGADSKMVAEKILKPFSNMDLYICGENYSEKYQQWMEGALDTSTKIIDMI